MMADMAGRISSAIARVDAAIAAHRRGTPAPLSPKLLGNVRAELERMLEAVRRRDYSPAYPRFIIDWPGDDEFVRDLVNLAYDFKRKVN